MEKIKRKDLPKLNDFPLYLYIIGILLLSLGITGQIWLEIRGNLWNKRPVIWGKVRDLIYPDFPSEDIQKNFDEICGPKGSVCPEIKQEELCTKAAEDLPSWWPPFLKKRGVMQRIYWAARMKEASLDYQTSEERLHMLEKRLVDEKNSSFLYSREKYEEEKLIYETLKAKAEKLQIKTGKEGFVAMILYYLLVLSISIASGYYLHGSFQPLISSKGVLGNWRLAYWSFFLVLYLCQTLVICYTSIWKVEKHWIGPSSFFVSWNAWCLERVGILGLSMIMAIPTTQLWCYMRKKLIPDISPIWLRRPDGRFEVRKYVLFLQMWTLIIFGAFSVISIVGIRWAASQQAQFENAYLVITVVGVGLASLMIGKMIRNAIELRRRYYDSLSRIFDSWSAIRNANIPPDPTIDFIGESWWKLPLNFTGIIAATWAILKWTGVATILVGTLK